MRQIDQLRTTSWLRDTAPDMLWLCYVISTAPSRGVGMATAAATLDALDDLWDEAPQEAVDGRLTRFERVPHDLRSRYVELLIDRDLYRRSFPQELTNLLLLYPTLPCKWLFEPWEKRQIDLQIDAADATLNTLLQDSWHGQDETPTHAKAMVLRALFKGGKVRIHRGVSDAFDLLPRYPDNLTEEELRSLRPVIRATFGAMAVQDPGDPSLTWAQEFWRRNWQLFSCRPSDENVQPSGITKDPARSGAASTESGDPAPANSESEQLLSQIKDAAEALNQRYVDVACGTDPDLYAPDRYEVLTGLVGRSIRLLAWAARTPVLWSAEHGSPVLRAVVETSIVLHWLLKKEKDSPTIYGQFKEYGRGHLKLLKLHVDEYVALLSDPPDDLLALQNGLDQEVNQDESEIFQNISLDSTFAKISLRDMAKEVDLDRDYKFIFAPTSSITHGEWYGLDRYVLQRCANLAHGMHRIPRRDLHPNVGVGLVDIALRLMNEVFDVYERSIAPMTPARDAQT